MDEPHLERFVSQLTRDAIAVIMAGGRGARLEDLTAGRAKPAVPFGGKFRIIDFVLSNCVNSGIRRISVLTQYKAHTLIQHLQRGWGYLRGELGEYIQIIPAQQQLGEMWYRGTADAVFQNLQVLLADDPSYVVVLAGDHIYKMDYGPMLAYHEECSADITVGVIQVPVGQARSFGVMTVDEHDRVVRFAEKPEQPEPMPGDASMALASMGIYIFGAGFLAERLAADSRDPASDHDFGKNIIPKAISDSRVFAYPFRDVATRAQHYWRDVGTVDTFFQANLELVADRPELNLYDTRWPVWTYQEQLPPAKFVFDSDGCRGTAINSLISGGCIVSGAIVTNSVLFSRVNVHRFAALDQAVVLPGAVIGEHCRIRRAIIDANTRIPEGTVIGADAEADGQRFYVSAGGVVLVCPHMLGQTH